jgi:hypothetical protein
MVQAVGIRIGWRDLPPGVQERAEEIVGGRVIEAVSQTGRQEMAITAALPAHAPVPGMLGGFGDGDWVVLALEDIEGSHPRTPWEAPEIDVAATTLRDLAAVNRWETRPTIPGHREARTSLVGRASAWRPGR